MPSPTRKRAAPSGRLPMNGKSDRSDRQNLQKSKRPIFVSDTSFLLATQWLVGVSAQASAADAPPPPTAVRQPGDGLFSCSRGVPNSRTWADRELERPTSPPVQM